MSKSNIVVVCLIKDIKNQFSHLLADKLEMCFVSTDDMFAKEEGGIKEVLDNFGSKYYENIEKQTLSAIKNFENTVAVSNAPTLFSEANLKKIKNNCLVLYYQINFKVFKKIKNESVTESNKAKLIMDEIVFAERDKLYCQNADIVVDGSSLKPKKVLKKAVKAIKNYYKNLK